MAKPRSPSGPTERRSGQDRRRDEKKGPPGTLDRRRLIEPRKPEVEEIEMSHSEWDALRRGVQAEPAPPPDGDEDPGRS